MAYFLGPLLGGEIAQYIGFSSLMSFIGVLNLCYGIYLMVTVLHILQPKVCIPLHSNIKSHFYDFFFFSSTTSMVHRWKINRFHCICGQTVPVLLCLWTISGSMLQLMGPKIERNTESKHANKISISCLIKQLLSISYYYQCVRSINKLKHRSRIAWFQRIGQETHITHFKSYYIKSTPESWMSAFQLHFFYFRISTTTTLKPVF